MYKRVKLSDQPQGFIINEKGERRLSTHEQMTRDFGRRVLQWWYMTGKRFGFSRDLIVFIGSWIPLDYQECPVWNTIQKYNRCIFKTIDPITIEYLFGRVVKHYFLGWTFSCRNIRISVPLPTGEDIIIRDIQIFEWFLDNNHYYFFDYNINDDRCRNYTKWISNDDLPLIKINL